MRVRPDGQVVRGNSWGEVVRLPTHDLLEDGSQGDLIDWSASVFSIDLFGALAPLDVLVTPQIDLDPPQVLLSATGDATATLVIGTGRWDLRETPIFVGDSMLNRVVVVKDE